MREARYGDRDDRCFTASGQNDVFLAAANDFPALSECVGPTGARGNQAVIGPHGPGYHGDLGRGHVPQHHWNKEWTHPARAAVAQDFELLREGRYAADAAADNDRHPEGVSLSRFQVGLPARLLGGDSGELSEPVHSPRPFALEVVLGVEPFDFGSKSRVEILGIKGRDEIDARPPFGYTVPSRRQVQPQGTDNADAGDKYPLLPCHNLPNTCTLPKACRAAQSVA